MKSDDELFTAQSEEDFLYLTATLSIVTGKAESSELTRLREEIDRAAMAREDVRFFAPPAAPEQKAVDPAPGPIRRKRCYGKQKDNLLSTHQRELMNAGSELNQDVPTEETPDLARRAQELFDEPPVGEMPATTVSGENNTPAPEDEEAKC